jgi:glycosyltransferase involved in cell wall biosynthesis
MRAIRTSPERLANAVATNRRAGAAWRLRAHGVREAHAQEELISRQIKSRRVLHVIDSLDLGGAQVVLLNLIRHADVRHHEIDVACLHGRGVYWRRLAAEGVRAHSLSFHHYIPSYVPGLLWLMLTRRYQIVHAHLLASNVIAKPLAALCRVPVRINHDHCNDKSTDPRKWAPAADKLTNRFSTHVIAVSDSTRRYVVDVEQVPPERVTTIHNGVDNTAFQPRPEQRAAAREKWRLPADAFVVAGIGRLTYQKNFALFLEIAAEVLRAHPQAFFVIAGTGEDEAALREQAQRLGIAERVRFLGYVAEMTKLYPAVDMLLLTSRYEGLPITILEAMAVGVPIVSSDLDGVQEILGDDEDAALVTPGDAAAFVGRIGTLISEPARAERYAAAALGKVRARYSAEAMTREVESIYERYLPLAL